ncbi:hypothetical protein [Microbulbifer sp.]|uniref:hypothetical protein n=1 Tax=Microbulbifer sp. TaxID=1908541 RepID=UPI002F953AE9
MQEYTFSKSFATLNKGCLLISVPLIALFAGLLFQSVIDPDSSGSQWIGALFGLILFVGLAVAIFRVLKSLPLRTLATDNEGIWYIHQNRERGLVPWEHIINVRERPLMQRLELLGSNGHVLIHVEYQLTGFETLRNTIHRKVDIAAAFDGQTRFGCSNGYHWLPIGSLVVWPSLGIYVGLTSSPGIGIAAVVMSIFIAWEYFTTATGVEIYPNAIEINYPAAKRRLQFSEIQDIRLTDSHHRGNRVPEVLISSRNSAKPHKLKQLGVDATVLFALLCKATGRKR